MPKILTTSRKALHYHEKGVRKHLVTIGVACHPVNHTGAHSKL